MILKTTTGFEIAGRNLRVAVTRGFWKTVSFLKTGSVEGFLDLSRDEQIHALGSLVRTHRIPVSRVFLSLPHELGMVREIEFPVEGIADLRGALELQLESWCPWSIDEVYWDFAADRGAKGSGTLTASVAIIPREHLDPWIELFRAAGVRLAGACLAPLAWAQAATILWPESPTIVLGCESEAVGGVLVQRSHSVAVRSVGDDTAEQAQDSIRRIVALGRLDAPENVRLVVHGSKADSLPSDPVRLPLESKSPVSSSVFGVLASALMGLRKTAFSTNLVPAEARYRQNRMQWIPTAALFGMLLLLGLVYLFQDDYQNVAYAGRLDSEIGRIAAEVGEVGDMESELDRLNMEYEVALSHLGRRDANLEALSELARLLPDTTFLSSYSYQNDTVTVSGFSESPSGLQRLLEDSDVFADVEFTAPLVRDSSGKDRFVIRASVEPSQ